jgi:hypothetical protein
MGTQEKLTRPVRGRSAAVLVLLALLLGGCTAHDTRHDASAPPSQAPRAARSTTPSPAAPSPVPALSKCPDLVLQWASTVFARPRLLTMSQAPSSTLDILACATDTADYRAVNGRGAVGLDFGRPDPAEVSRDYTVRAWALIMAKAMLNLECGDTPPTNLTVGTITELSCVRQTAEPGLHAAFAVANDHAAASAALDYVARTPPDPATRDYITAVARSAAYAALGTL